ncbi:hypothetical protein [Loigolactobacillus iwatensis]|uniref:hypothetical protein n=1 Tax=Loigolactobacillus iwatensis TaxID=1267156 RepID=UPI000F7E4A99|nr:hypothetical protein [Loigolactobacillus iwatensis]
MKITLDITNGNDFILLSLDEDAVVLLKNGMIKLERSFKDNFAAFDYFKELNAEMMVKSEGVVRE